MVKLHNETTEQPESDMDDDSTEASEDGTGEQHESRSKRLRLLSSAPLDQVTVDGVLLVESLQQVCSTTVFLLASV